MRPAVPAATDSTANALDQRPQCLQIQPLASRIRRHQQTHLAIPHRGLDFLALHASPLAVEGHAGLIGSRDRLQQRPGPTRYSRFPAGISPRRFGFVAIPENPPVVRLAMQTCDWRSPGLGADRLHSHGAFSLGDLCDGNRLSQCLVHQVIKRHALAAGEIPKITPQIFGEVDNGSLVELAANALGEIRLGDNGQVDIFLCG